MNTKKLAIIFSLTALLLLGIAGIKFSNIGQQQKGGLGTAEAAGDLNLELSIKEPNGVNRVNESITSGIPLPKSLNITNDQILQIVDANGNSVPAQFRTTVRWDGLLTDITKPIKWVLVDFQANVPANGEARYYLKDGGTGNTSNGLSIQNNASDYAINTGQAEFKISKTNFNLFEQVTVNGQDMVTQDQTNGISITGIDDKTYNTHNTQPSEITIEEQGPIRSVIKVHGWHTAQDSSQLLEYTARLHFYKDKSYAKVFYTLENNGKFAEVGGDNRYFKELILNTNLNLADTKTVTHGKGAPEWWINEGQSQSSYQDTFIGQEIYYLYQDHHWNNSLNQSRNFFYKIYKGGTPQPQGTWTKIDATGYTDVRRNWVDMSYDKEHNVSIFFGGGGNTYMNDVWKFDLSTKTWSLMQPYEVCREPFRRDMHMMVYDPVNQIHWMEGGIAYNSSPDKSIICPITSPTGQSKGGTWYYDLDTNAWSEIPLNPKHGKAGGMDYDSENKVLVKFGGEDVNPISETWVFDTVGKSWTRVYPSVSPPARLNIHNSFVYMPDSRVFILFGGNSGEKYYGDTWVYDYNNNTWTEMHPAVSPPPRTKALMAYDPVNKVVVLFGGAGPAGLFRDTWIYDVNTNTWQGVSTLTAPSTKMTMIVYDEAHQVFVATNGPEVWTFKYEPKPTDYTEVDNGIRTSGWTDISDGTQGLTVAVKDFWQNFPKGMEVNGNKMSIGLWPKESHGPEYPGDNQSMGSYRFAGGNHKTYELLYYFHNNDAAGAGSQQLTNSFNSPLFAFAPSAWYTQSGALGIPSVERKDWNNPNNVVPELAEAFNLYEKIQAVKWNKNEAFNADYKESVYSFWERGGTYGGNQNYGWFNYGDITWGEGYSSLHYQWPFGMLFNFLRTGGRPFLDLGVAMTRHRIDIDQYHYLGGQWGGGQQYEQGYVHGHPYFNPEASHTWIQGVLLYYVLTGDVRALETAKETGKFYDWYWGSKYQWSGSWGIRIPGWTAQGLAELYQYTGDTSYLDKAKKLIDSVIDIEQNQYGGQGYVLNPEKGYVADSWLQAVMASGAFEYVEAIKQRGEKDQRTEDYLVRIADWFMKRGGEGPLRGGTGPDSSYIPYSINNSWAPGVTGENNGRILDNSWATDVLSYAYLITQNDAYRTLARSLFQDGVKYWQRQPDAPVDKNNPSYISSITMKPTYFSQSESKVMGYWGRNGKTYMYMETEFEPDVTAPAPISDLSVSLGTEGGTVNLIWKATGDDGLEGQSARYIVKYADFEIREANWESAITFGQSLIPKPSGQSESLKVSGLVGNKEYYFALKAVDDAGNISLISNVPKIFVSKDETAPLISEVLSKDVKDTEATITWKTDEPANSQVEYGKDTNYGSKSALSTDYVTSLSVKITGLSMSTQYHYRVISEDKSSNKAVSEDRIFTTSDFTPPVISNISTSNIESYSVTVNWQTDEPATSQIEYGSTNAYGSKTPLDTNLVTDPSVTIIGLNENTDYHYRILSKDSSGNQAQSADKTFYTPPFGGQVIIFQEGRDGYTGTSDTCFYTYRGSEHKNYGSLTELRMSGDSWYGPLIKFALFEDEGGLIPRGSQIGRATLKLYNPVGYEGNLAYYKVLKHWEENKADWTDAIHPTKPWGALGANQAGVDREADPEGQMSYKAKTWNAVDVTQSVHEFSNGEVNEGWIFIPLNPGINMVRAYSSEYQVDPTLRPILEISYTPVPAPKPELTLTKSALVNGRPASEAASGDIITYAIVYQNIGTGDASNVIITDPIPQGTSYVTGSADATGGSFDGTQVVWNIDEVKAGGSGSVGFQVRVE